MSLRKFNQLLSSALIIVCIVAAVQFVKLENRANEVVMKLNAAIARASADEGELSQHLEQDEEDTHRVMLEAGLTAEEFRKAAKEQRGYWNESLKQTIWLLHDADATVNQIKETNRQLQADFADTANSVTEALGAVPPVMQKAGRDLDSLNGVIADPAIKNTLAHLDSTSGHFEHSSALIDKKVEQTLKPAGLVKTLFEKVLDLSYKLHTFF